MDYKSLVQQAKQTINSRQCGYPYNGTRKVHNVALALAQDAGETFLDSVGYSHYYGTSYYATLPADSPVWAVAEAMPRGVWQTKADDALKAAVAVAKRTRMSAALAKARAAQGDKHGQWCSCARCRHKKESAARHHAYKRQLEAFTKPAKFELCGATPAERLAQLRENVAALSIPAKWLKGVSLTKKFWCKSFRTVTWVAASAKPLTALQSWLVELGMTNEYNWTYFTLEDSAEGISSFKTALGDRAKYYFVRRGNLSWAGEFVREWNLYSGYLNPKTRPTWQPYVKRFLVRRLCETAVALGWTWGVRDGIVYFDLPTGQASFHLRYNVDRDAVDKFNPPVYVKPWSGVRNSDLVLDAQFKKQTPQSANLAALLVNSCESKTACAVAA